jgi:RNA polymerase sigma factor (sigma-70 family)
MNEWLKSNYSRLVAYASKYSDHPSDLVHEAYIAMQEAGFKHQTNQQTDTYFKRTIYTRANNLRKTYASLGSDLIDVAEAHDVERRITIEQLDSVIRLMDEFDRIIFDLQLQGQNMRELSEQSGIPLSTIYHSLVKSRKIVRDNV